MAKRPEINDTDTENTGILSYSEDITTAEKPAPLPEGEYIGTIEKAELKTSAAKGTKYVAVSFKVPVESYPADYDVNNAPNGTTLTFMIMAADLPRNRHAMRKFCEAVGAPTGTEIRYGEWQGLSGRLTIAHETYEGEINARIKKVEAE